MVQDESATSPNHGRLQELDWPFILRLILKAAGLFLILNLLFAALSPLDYLGSLSLYNWLLPGRLRLPYGENSAESYNLSLDNIPAMMASHVITRPKAEDELRLLIIGDSGTWGWFLENNESLAGQINAGDYETADGRRIVAYNLGYPIMSLAKDLIILDEARRFDPDLVLWPVTLQSFPKYKQLDSPLVHDNPDRVRSLVDNYGLDLDLDSGGLNEPGFLSRTIVGQRRALADLLRLQTVGFSWAATDKDQVIPEEVPLRAVDLEPDVTWLDFEETLPLTGEVLALDALEAGLALAGDVPVLIVNEPIFISDGQNSDLRYNAWYPRWAYDGYRDLMSDSANEQGWFYLDLWDRISPSEFTDSPVHLTPAGTKQLSELLVEEILNITNEMPGNFPE